MGVLTTTAGTDLLSSAAPPDYNAPYTAMWWVYYLTVPPSIGNFAHLMQITNGTAYDIVTTDRDPVSGTGVTLGAWVYDGATLVTAWDTVGGLAANTWYHVAMVRTSATVLLLYLNGALLVTNTHTTIAGRSAATIAKFPLSANARVAASKVWDVALTDVQVQAEVNVIRPRLGTTLRLWAPHWVGSGERTRDYSGNGRDWVENGTIADADSPPVSYGAPGPGPTAHTGPVAQYARPTSDISAGTWTPSSGGTLAPMVDEVVADDSDTIASAVNPVADTCEIKLGPLTDPLVGTGHILRLRLRKKG